MTVEKLLMRFELQEATLQEIQTMRDADSRQYEQQLALLQTEIEHWKKEDEAIQLVKKDHAAAIEENEARMNQIGALDRQLQEWKENVENARHLALQGENVSTILQNELDACKKKSSTLQTELEGMQESLRETQALSGFHEARAEHEQEAVAYWKTELEQSQAKYVELVDQASVALENLSGERARNEVIIQELDQCKIDLATALEACRTQKQAFEVLELKYQGLVEKTAETLDELQMSSETCAMLSRANVHAIADFDRVQEQLCDIESQLSDSEQKCKSLSRELDATKNIKQELTTSKDALEASHKRTEEINKELRTAMHSNSELNAKLQHVTEQLDIVSNTNMQLETFLEDTNEAVDTSRGALREAQAELSKVKEKDAALYELNASHANLTSSLDLQTAEMEMLRQKCENFDQLLHDSRVTIRESKCKNEALESELKH